ncbi:hypothetical protein LF845_04440 [Deferribacterales bacterium Es71-Z0220]|uniref:hypothetical protein n=1 Tax=Deferrivibrio essentukiensis TaxID=2880922 RepID=UPI001F620D68|nr:hypothetical protein [Deferrivibrio essentukiensis]MCB4204207.1 hypothetical protein [Deferrivibrio essentukiensis]
MIHLLMYLIFVVGLLLFCFINGCDVGKTTYYCEKCEGSTPHRELYCSFEKNYNRRKLYIECSKCRSKHEIYL